MSSIKFSAASKMPCFSWSLEAMLTCAGAVDIVTGAVGTCDLTRNKSIDAAKICDM